MSAPPSDTAWEAAWDEDSSKFYDDDTGWSERGYAQGFAAGATWGAEWYAGHMAVCEFLSDLAAQVNACRHCLGSGQVYGGRGCSVIEACPTCKGTGKRVTP